MVGKSTLAMCLTGGLLHRAIAVLVLRSDGDAVLQQRSKSDLWHPGLWTLSTTGHVRSGETYDQAAKREMMEELGLQSEVSRIGKYRMPQFTDGKFIENEWVILYSSKTDEVIRADPDELEGTDEVPMAELTNMAEGGQITPDSKILIGEFLTTLKESSDYLKELTKLISGSGRVIVIADTDVDLRSDAPDNRLVLLKMLEGSSAAGGRGGGFGERRVTAVAVFQSKGGKWTKIKEIVDEGKAQNFEVPYYVSRLPFVLSDGSESMGYGVVDPELTGALISQAANQ